MMGVRSPSVENPIKSPNLLRSSGSGIAGNRNYATEQLNIGEWMLGIKWITLLLANIDLTIITPAPSFVQAICAASRQEEEEYCVHLSPAKIVTLKERT